MSYQVLARKWRPQTFAEVVGQEHISRTLKNAIRQNRIGHAYLFVGSRGIGKTTTARIFAKALNCMDNVDGEPCCKCQSCREIAAGTSLDVIEIDGASHNKVEDVRDIRENVQYAPTMGKYKIYIIDEVHMLTTQAWNALLKTLEEPPPHVKFLFATTEPHKVLPTIVSRCQRFDLKRIPVPLIVQRLRQIADGEQVHVEDGALGAIARAADGGMRDAQSIFDQMIAFCGGLEEGELIREQDVIDVFGLASGMELREMAAGLFTNDINRSMKVLQDMADGGRDLERLFGDLIGYVRNVMVASVCKDAPGFLEVSETELADLLAIGKALDPLLVQRVLQGLVAQEWSFRSALNKRIYFEAVLARVMLEAHSVQLNDIAAQLNVLRGTMPMEAMPERPVVVIPPPVVAESVLSRRPTAPQPVAPQPVVEMPQPVAPEQAVVTAPEPTQPVASQPIMETPQPVALEQAVVTAPEPSQSVAPEPVVATEHESSQPVASEPIMATPQPVAPEQVVVTASEPPQPVAQESVGETPQVVESAPAVPESAQPVASEPVGEEQGAPVEDEDLINQEFASAEMEMMEQEPMAQLDPLLTFSRLSQILNERYPAKRDLITVFGKLAPLSFDGRKLILAYNEVTILQQEVVLLTTPASEQTLKDAMAMAVPRGVLEIVGQRPEVATEHDKTGYRLASTDEWERMAEHPFVKHFNEVLNSHLVDARIQDR